MRDVILRGAVRGLYGAAVVLTLPPLFATAVRFGFLLSAGRWFPYGDTPFGI